MRKRARKGQPQAKGPGLGGPSVEITRMEPVAPKPLSANALKRLHEEAHAHNLTAPLLVESALRDRLAVQAARIAYRTQSGLTIEAPTAEDRRIFEQLVENVTRIERVAVLKIVMEWATHHGIHWDLRSQLDTLIEEVRGPLDSERLRDRTAVGMIGEDGRSLTTFRKSHEAQYRLSTRNERIGAPQALTLKMEWKAPGDLDGDTELAVAG